MALPSSEFYCHQEKVIAALEENIKNLTGWQKTQNGTLIRLEEKIDKLVWWILGTFATFSIGVVSAVVYAIYKLN